MARAKATLFFIPPDNSEGNRSSTSCHNKKSENELHIEVTVDIVYTKQIAEPLEESPGNSQII
jgi:hypothetical protein